MAVDQAAVALGPEGLLQRHLDPLGALGQAGEDAFGFSATSAVCTLT